LTKRKQSPHETPKSAHSKKNVPPKMYQQKINPQKLTPKTAPAPKISFQHKERTPTAFRCWDMRNLHRLVIPCFGGGTKNISIAIALDVSEY
jgi:hypothetical protein